MVGVQDELDEYFRRFGTHHPACGRSLLHGRHTAAAPWLEEKVRQPSVTREPIRHIIEGARAFNAARGLGDPHDIDYRQVATTADRIHHLARAYDRAPMFDPAAVPHFEAMRRQVHDQFDHLTNRMGIRAEFVDHDPYRNSHEMAQDLRDNRRIQVLRTSQTGGHPFFTDHENDMFRAVHDAFGHAGTGRDFDGHGEHAAWLAHSRMFTPDAVPALSSETQGQNGHLIYHGSFGPQKIAVLPRELWTPQSRTAAVNSAWREGQIKTCPCGDKCTFDLQDGWQHLDGSIGCHDGGTCGDRMACTACSGTGEQGTGHECYQCDGTGLREEQDPDVDNANPASGLLVGRDDGKGVLPVLRTEAMGARGPDYDNRNHQRVGIRADQVEEYRLNRHLQERRAEEATGGYRTELEDYFGRGGNDAVEQPLTFQDWLRHSRPQRLGEMSGEDQANWRGYELGHAHGRAGKVDAEELEREHSRSPHQEHFRRGYEEGLDDAMNPEARFAVLRNAVASTGGPVMVRIAHVSGNTIDAIHCPFCFAGEVRYITKDGVKSFAETVGTTQWVLTGGRAERDGGRWVQAEIKEFGIQRLMKVTLRRNKREKVVYATPEHRWLVKSGPGRREDRDVLTRDLQPDYRLSHLRSLQALDMMPSVAGIRHGVVFGDGSAHTNRPSAYVTLWGEKDKQLLQYFPDRNYTPMITPNGVAGVRVTGGLSASMKAVPSLTESDDYLFGWLAGYFAADGTVSAQGQATLYSAQLEHLEAVRDIAQRVGISTYGIVSKMRRGFGQDRLIHSIEFVGSTVPESFFLIEDHRSRFALRSYSYERFGWTVVSVEESDRVEPVYCAIVPETHSFALEDNIWVGNCGSGSVTARSDGSIECAFCTACYTVQVQPQYAAFPQSVNGAPYPWPGRDDMGGGLGDDGMDPAMGGDPMMGAPVGGGAMPGTGTPVIGGDGADVEDGDEDDDDGPPWAKDGDDESDDDADAKPGKDKATVKGKDKPPFGKKSYRNARGAQLSEDDYLRHLAIVTAHDPAAMAAAVKASRS